MVDTVVGLLVELVVELELPSAGESLEATQ